jgi:hypothetical protein
MGKYVWIYSDYYNDPPTYSHEIGHNIKLDDEYKSDTGPDVNNLMNNKNGVQLRKFQWDTIQE